MIKKMWIITISIVLAVGMVSCNQIEDDAVSYSQMTKYKVAILGKEGYVFSDIGFLNGLDMAAKKLTEAKGPDFTWEHYDDDGEYEQGIIIGTQLAGDDSIIGVLTFQDFEVIEALVPIFEQQKKPFISVQGCYETTLAKKHQYFFSTFLSARELGAVLVDYIADKGIQNVACSHSDTTFELDEIRGFQENAREKGIDIVDMVQGPSTMNELRACYRRWKSLNVDAVFLAHYTYQNADWMLQMIQYLREQDQELMILSDYSLNSEKRLEEYGTSMEGAVIAAPYPVENKESLKQFETEYEKRFGLPPTNAAMQSYDLVGMLAHHLKNGAVDAADLVGRMKAADGYEGVTGKIRFDENGSMYGITPQYLIVRDSRFVIDE